MDENGGVDTSDIDADDLSESTLTRIQSQEQLNETADTSVAQTVIIPNKKASSLVSLSNTTKSEPEISTIVNDKDDDLTIDKNQTKVERSVSGDFTQSLENCSDTNTNCKRDDENELNDGDVQTDNYDADSLKMWSLTLANESVSIFQKVFFNDFLKEHGTLNQRALCLAGNVLLTTVWCKIP